LGFDHLTITSCFHRKDIRAVLSISGHRWCPIATRKLTCDPALIERLRLLRIHQAVNVSCSFFNPVSMSASGWNYAEEMTGLVWDGYVNARDLGGFPTALSSTGVTVSGRIARGPRRERLTAAGWDDARAWGLASVVDLRCTYEVGQGAGDPVISDEVLSGFAIVNAPTEDQDDPEFMEICVPILDSPEYWAHNWRLQPELVRGALEAIASAQPGTLVHCSAGRDRTGMISALLLGNAGVDPNAVAADYAASVHAMATVAQLAPGVDPQTTRSRKEVDEWMLDKLPIVRDTATRAAAIFDLLGVSGTTRTRLRAILIEQ